MKADPQQTKRLLNIAKGQINGLIKMVDENRYCMDISHQLMATSAILNRLNRDILKAHIKGCIQHALEQDNPVEIETKTNELIELIDRL